jgi:acetyl esterase/lipase
MASLIGLVSLSLSLFSASVTSIASPQSIESDLSIITHNDLYGNLTSRRAASIVISTPSKYSTATSKCAALGTTLWDPDTHKQDLGYLQYLDYEDGNHAARLYWIKGNSTTLCRAITTRGDCKRYPCDTPLPALCSNTVTDEVRQVAVLANNATIVGQREKSNSSFRFLGIKYASIPARFSHSTYLPPTPGSSISALEYGPRCIQAGCGSTGEAPCSEDCLSLNIWTPYLPNGNATAKKKAVMVWIYGGAFASGAASDTTFDGSSLASRGDVVLVTINYRLSNFGFLVLENTSLTGNYGLRDQSTALDWLRAHVGAFGGDENRITIFGQSAGAASVRALLASPQAQTKFSGAIMQSTPQGLGSVSTYAKYLTIAEATNRTKAVITEVGCGQLAGDALVACLRKVDPLKLIAGTIAT